MDSMLMSEVEDFLTQVMKRCAYDELDAALFDIVSLLNGFNNLAYSIER